MTKGRPPNSIIRERMQQIVDALGVSYGYEIYKVYTDSFSSVGLRSMYYHLAKGVGLNEFGVVGVKQEKGDFTWGDVSVRKYYILGPAAEQRATDDIRVVVKTLKLERKEPDRFVDWGAVLREKTNYFKTKISFVLKVGKPDPGALLKLKTEINTTIDWFGENKIKPTQLKDLYDGFVKKIAP